MENSTILMQCPPESQMRNALSCFAFLTGTAACNETKLTVVNRAPETTILSPEDGAVTNSSELKTVYDQFGGYTPPTGMRHKPDPVAVIVDLKKRWSEAMLANLANAQH